MSHWLLPHVLKRGHVQNYLYEWVWFAWKKRFHRGIWFLQDTRKISSVGLNPGILFVLKFDCVLSFLFLQVLQKLRYVDANNTVQLKGRVACEISNHELIITELVFENAFTNLHPTEIVALLSCFVFQQVNAWNILPEHMCFLAW